MSARGGATAHGGGVCRRACLVRSTAAGGLISSVKTDTAPSVAAARARRRFVPSDLTVRTFDDVAGLYNELEGRDVTTPERLQQFLSDFSELTSVVDEHASRLYIAKTCHTDDEAAQSAYLFFVEHVEPRIKPAFFRLQKKAVSSPAMKVLAESDGRLHILSRNWSADVELFREENVPLEVEVNRLTNDYDKVCGAMTAVVDGREYTLPQAARFLEETDRELRERAWRAVAERRLADRERLDDLFDQLIPLRQRIATNSGFQDYRSYVWKQLKRFDYSPDDCLAFHDAVEKAVVPVVRDLDRQRARALGLSVLRPWDGDVDVHGRPPLRPFDPSDVDGFVSRTKALFERLSPELAEQFETLRTHGNLDLASRKGKAPGGYQSTLDEVRQPFIFMNAAGTQRDVETLLHEGGHAFHALAAAAEPLVFLRSAPIEFCEVASMAMELLACDHFELIYPDDPASAARAKRLQLEGNIRILAWIATIDAFQHWLYTHPQHTRAERTAAWLGVRSRFMGEVDFSGLEPFHEAMWQRQLHLYHLPFYYIEYGIAQLGALQLYQRSQHDPQGALANYRHALSLGGTRPLPRLFEAAGLHFDFSAKTVSPLVNAVVEELAALPA